MWLYLTVTLSVFADACVCVCVYFACTYVSVPVHVYARVFFGCFRVGGWRVVVPCAHKTLRLETF